MFRRREGRRRRLPGVQRIQVGLAPRCPGLTLAMAERRGGVGARLARFLAGLGARRGRRGKVTSEEARSQNR